MIETRPSWMPQRYYSWNEELKAHFGEKVVKIALDAGFDCPNRDGTVAYGGCTFCSVRGSGDFAGDRKVNLAGQFEERKQVMTQKWPARAFMAYFQAYTNTHAPVDELREKFESVLELEGVVGLSIATRPDCLPPDVVDYLAELHERTYLWVELGLQTAHDETGVLINRAHDYQCFEEGVAKLRDRGIRVCTHIINGLPQETPAMMVETAELAAQLDIQGMKIHLLHLLRKTSMVRQYKEGLVDFLSQEEYVQIVCDQLERIPASISIHRLTGDGPQELLIGPQWSTDKWGVLNGIKKELKRRDSWQGKFAAVKQEERK
ncbi:TIGR01212 family radical SAM protein [Alkalicoccus chagannorensis]|uniref:TIGR01212 family radical SAM protein n=1 Tax=Alkalicoccus chagannorensis TaxID=427072 RepID=UPI00041D2376|nr:TIGR01212 family radical SAM protein [Alkalicoccus chagannorensis]